MSSLRRSLFEAMRHPGLIGMMFIFRLLVAALVAMPLSQALCPTWVMSQPRRDESLFQSGSELLVRVVSERHDAIARSLQFGVWILLGAVFVGTALSTYQLVALQASRDANILQLLRTVVLRVPRQIAIVVLYWIAVIAVAMLTKTLIPLVPPLVYPWVGERGTDVAILSLFGLAVVALGVLRLVCDLTRAGSIRFTARLTTIIAGTFVELRRRIAFWLFACIAWLCLILAAPTVVACRVPALGGSTEFGLVPAALRQCAVLFACTMHLGWWVFALHNAQTESSPAHPVLN